MVLSQSFPARGTHMRFGSRNKAEVINLKTPYSPGKAASTDLAVFQISPEAPHSLITAA